MDKRKLIPNKKPKKIQVDDSKKDTLSNLTRNLSHNEIQSIVTAFHNPDKHKGIATMSLHGDDIPYPPPRKIADDLLAFSALDTSVNIQAYWNMHCIPQAMVHRWRDDPYFKECYDLAKERIGVRREAFFIGDSKAMYSSMAIYSQDYRELKQWEKSLDKKDENQTNVILAPDWLVKGAKDERVRRRNSSGPDHGQDMRPSMEDTQPDPGARTGTERTILPEDDTE